MSKRAATKAKTGIATDGQVQTPEAGAGRKLDPDKGESTGSQVIHQPPLCVPTSHLKYCPFTIESIRLAHSARTVGGRHYSNFRDFAALRLVSQELHVELTAAGMFSKPAAKTSRKLKRQLVEVAA